MPKRIVDVTYRKFESVCKGTQLPKGVLDIIEGPAMDMEKVNENNRFYPTSLVVNKILNDPDTLHLMKNRALLGEGCHPDDRFEVRYPYVAFMVEKLWIPEGKNELWGRFVIIDTPNGRILKTLIDVGSSIGISARALGTSYETPEGYEMMNEEDYTFFTFDAVPDPGFKIARPSPVFESKSKKELKEVISGYSPAEMEISRVLMESINPDFFAEELQVINESLKKDSSKELLENSQRRINSLEKALEREKERQTVQASLGESRLPKSVLDRVRLMQESVSQSEAEIGLLKSKVVSLNESLEREKRESKRLKSQIQSQKAAPVSESKDLTKLKGTIAQYEAREKKLKASIKEDRIKALSLVTGMSESKVASMVSNLDEPLEDIAVRLKRLMSKDTNQPVLEARQKGAGEAQESDRTVRLIKSQQK